MTASSQDGAVLADALVAVLGAAGAAHAGPEAAAHALFKAELPIGAAALPHGVEHGLRPAGIEVGVIHALHTVGDKTADPGAAVGGEEADGDAQRMELLHQKNI